MGTVGEVYSGKGYSIYDKRYGRRGDDTSRSCSTLPPLPPPPERAPIQPTVTSERDVNGWRKGESGKEKSEEKESLQRSGMKNIELIELDDQFKFL